MSTTGNISVTKFDVTFEWTISNFISVIEDSAEDKKILSPRFSFSDCNWLLETYLDSGTNWISLYLKVDSITDCKNIVTISISFVFHLKKVDGTCIADGLQDDAKLIFKKDKLAWGYDEFIDFNTLRNDYNLASSDTIKIICCMQEGKPQEMWPLMELTKLETLSSNLKDLYINKKKCDVTIKVKDQEFQAHKAILVARSSVFGAMFDSNTEEEISGIVTIEDCDPDSFSEFLHFLYTGKVEHLSFLNARHLYVTADKYDVQELKRFCRSYMMEHFTVSNVCDTIVLAEKYDDTPLMSSAQLFFNQNAYDIVSTAEWETILKENYFLANEMFKNAFKSKFCSKLSKQ